MTLCALFLEAPVQEFHFGLFIASFFFCMVFEIKNLVEYFSLQFLMENQIDLNCNKKKHFSCYFTILAESLQVSFSLSPHSHQSHCLLSNHFLSSSPWKPLSSACPVGWALPSFLALNFSQIPFRRFSFFLCETMACKTKNLPLHLFVICFFPFCVNK